MKLWETLRKIWRALERGYERMAYTELYNHGAIDLKEYLKLIKETEEDD